MTRPNPHIALIYHYDLARALAGEVVDWQAIPVNVDAGREGGDLCRAAADFAKRRDLFAMPAPSVGEGVAAGSAPLHVNALTDTPSPAPSAVPPSPNPAVEQQAADPEPSTASTAVPGTAVMFDEWLDEYADGEPDEVTGADELRVAMAWDRACLIARIKDLVDTYPRLRNNDDTSAETLLRRHWPEGVPTLKHDGHTDAQLQLILACVRRVEAEVGAGWHPDDGPPPHVNTNPRASIDYPLPVAPDEGGPLSDDRYAAVHQSFRELDIDGLTVVTQIGKEAMAAGRSISVQASPTVRRWSIARAVIAWAASGRTVDELWFAASNLATFEQCQDPSATLGGLISQFTIEQADRLYGAAGQ